MVEDLTGGVNDNEGADSGGSYGTEAVALSARDNAGVRALIRGLPAELAQSRRDDGRTRDRGRSFDRSPMGHQAPAGA